MMNGHGTSRATPASSHTIRTQARAPRVSRNTVANQTAGAATASQKPNWYASVLTRNWAVPSSRRPPMIHPIV